METYAKPLYMRACVSLLLHIEWTVSLVLLNLKGLNQVCVALIVNGTICQSAFVSMEMPPINRRGSKLW